MLVDCLVRSVKRGGTIEKPFATLVIETDQPLEIIEMRLFSNSINDGSVATLEQSVGKAIKLPLSANVYQGRLQFQLPFDAVIDVPSSPKAAAK